jgi:octaprenyl-diphosphate synthase
MGANISEIKAFLKDDLDKYKKTLADVLSSNVFLIDNITKYIVKHKGKGLRPLLVLLSAKLLSSPNEKTYLVAAIVELLHTATLIHDDVVDEAVVRRGFPSINAIWKNKISVLMGDYLLAKSLISATETGDMQIMSTLADTAKRLSKGELLQIEKSRKLDITEAEYFRMISDKTAALISACCELGAMTVSDQLEEREALRIYGENIGVAFQIKDDLLDYQGNQIVLGKPVGADLKEKKITLPLILSFKNSPTKEKKRVLQLIKKGVTQKDINRIYEFIQKYDGLQLANDYALSYSEKAKQALVSIKEGSAKDKALTFVDYIINRKK